MSLTVPSFKAIVLQGPIGPAGSGGSGAARVIGETLTGTINGSNATFTTAFSFVPSSVEIYINGLRQKLVTHYTTSGTTTVIFSDSPQAGDTLLINYERP